MSDTRGQDEPERAPSAIWRLLVQLFDNLRDELFGIVIVSIAALVRAMGATIESGWTGLRFTLGRAGSELQPGFHPLIPFLQKVKRLPTRARTLDLPAQRVATFQGLVYHVDANLVYRVADVRKALIQIDQLEKGMLQMLGLGVQEVLRAADRDELRVSARLDERLAANLARRLEPWGVVVESAGFPSITPSPQTLRITQMVEVALERRERHAMLCVEGVPPRGALGLVGTRHMPRGRTRALQHFELRRRRMRRLKKTLVKRGWKKAQIKQAEYKLLARITTPGRVRPAVSR